MSEGCCQRFRPHFERPDRYQPPARLDLEAIGRTADGGRVTVTARALLLTRDVTVQTSRDEIYDFDSSGFRLPPWHHDTYAGGLGLTPGLIRGWRDRGARVLDVAAGLSLFATEALALGLEVDCADLELDHDSPMFQVAKSVIAKCYPDQLELLRCLSRHSGNPTYRLSEPESELLEELYQKRHATVGRYPRPSGRRFRADARHLAEVADDVYDAAICGWLLVHLTEQAEQDTIAALARVVRPGGQVRLKAGTGDDLAERFRTYQGLTPSAERCRLGSAKVAIDDGESKEDLLVLRVTG